MSGSAAAYAAVVRANALITDLDLSRRMTDVGQIVGGVRAELQKALEALQADVEGDHPGRVRRDASDTSRAAAMTVRSGTARARVLIALWRKGSCTDRELQQALAMSASTQRPRRGELVRMGYVIPAEGTREHDGRAWTLWRVTVAGAVMARQLDVNPSAPLAPTPQGEQGTLL